MAWSLRRRVEGDRPLIIFLQEGQRLTTVSDRAQREARIHSPLSGVNVQCSLFEVG